MYIPLALTELRGWKRRTLAGLLSDRRGNKRVREGR